MKVMLDEGAFMPVRAHDVDAGYDLKTPVCVRVEPYEFVAIDTGVHIQLPHGCCAVVMSKSGLYTNHRITSTGLVDEGYTGSIVVGLINHSDRPYTFKRGDKISQFYITNYIVEELELADSLDASDRGNEGFGSTGK